MYHDTFLKFFKKLVRGLYSGPHHSLSNLHKTFSFSLSQVVAAASRPVRVKGEQEQKAKVVSRQLTGRIQLVKKFHLGHIVFLKKIVANNYKLGALNLQYGFPASSDKSS